MIITLTPLSTLLIGLVAGLGSSFLFKRLTVPRSPSLPLDKASLLTKHPRPNQRLDLGLLIASQTLRHANGPKRKEILNIC